MSGYRVKWSPGLESSLIRASAAAQLALESQVVKDTAPYVPFDQGPLSSSVHRSINDDGYLVWDTVYAWRQYYYLPNKSKSPNAKATKRWFEASKAAYSETWRRVSERAARAGRK